MTIRRVGRSAPDTAGPAAGTPPCELTRCLGAALPGCRTSEEDAEAVINEGPFVYCKDDRGRLTRSARQ